MSRDGKIRQIFAVFSVNLMACSMGASIAWPSYALKKLGTFGYDLEKGPLTEHEQKQTLFLYNVGGLLGAVMFAYISKVTGRKTILKLTCMLHFIAYILIAYAHNGVMIMASRFMLGVAASGISITIPLFVCEIAENKIRGALGSIFTLMTNLGILLSFSISMIMNYFYIVWIFMIFPVLFFAFSQFFREGPLYLIERRDPGKAKDSLRFYRGVKSADRSKVQVEFDSLQQFIKFYDSMDESTKISDFLTKAAGKSIIIGAVLVALEQFSGYFFMIIEAGNIFRHVETTSPEMAAIFVYLFELFGILFAIILSDTVGRKVLLAMSFIGVAFGMLVYGTSEEHMITKNLSIVGLAMIIFSGGLGIRTLPYVVLTEICPANIRCHIVSICVTFSWIFGILLKSWHAYIMDKFGAEALLYWFSVNCIFGACFVIFCIPETRRKSLLEITERIKN